MVSVIVPILGLTKAGFDVRDCLPVSSSFVLTAGSSPQANLSPSPVGSTCFFNPGNVGGKGFSLGNQHLALEMLGYVGAGVWEEQSIR